MFRHMVSPGIRFNDCFFTEPVRLANWQSPQCAGLFVILVSDSTWAPKPLRPLCFGEFGNDSRKAVEAAGYAWLVNAANTGYDLYVSVVALPFSTTSQRLSLCRELSSAYNPALQVNASEDTELVRRLEDLESRFHAQTAQVLLMLGNLNKQFEPLPVPPRRSIGFLAEPERTKAPKPTGTGS